MASTSIKGRMKRTANRLLRPAGVQLQRIEQTATAPQPPPVDPDPRLVAQEADEWAIVARHRTQTRAEFDRLTEKYERPVFGSVAPWELVMMLGHCVDPTDRSIGTASQLTHVLQIVDAMGRDGVTDEDLVLAAVVHDFGKLLLLTDEAPENVVCMNKVLEVGDPTDPTSVVSQWNHDEFLHLRLGPLLPPETALTLRYHSVMPADLEAALDVERCAAFLGQHRRFFHYDQGSKSPVLRPRTSPADLRGLVERRLPARIEF